MPGLPVSLLLLSAIVVCFFNPILLTPFDSSLGVVSVGGTVVLVVISFLSDVAYVVVAVVVVFKPVGPLIPAFAYTPDLTSATSLVPTLAFISSAVFLVLSFTFSTGYVIPLFYIA